MDLKVFVLILLAVILCWDLLILFLQSRSTKNKIPENVKELYSPDEHKKWACYMREKTRLSVFKHIAAFILEFSLLLFDVYAAFCGLFGPDKYLQMFAAVLMNSFLSTLIAIPFDWVDTMKIEEKYGFNKCTKKTFIADAIKDFIIDLIISTALGALYALVMGFGIMAVIILAAALIVFILLMIFLAPVLQKLNNKFTPLEDGELKDKLTALLTQHGFKVRGIQVMDGSKRSTRSNAFFAGFGKTKKIVLFDTLIANSTPDEIVAVFAHELGHGIHKDTLKLLPASALQMIAIAVMLFFAASEQFGLSAAFGFDKTNYGFCLVLATSIGFALLSPLLGLLTNYLSRRAEYAADAQAVKEGYGDALISGLKRLHKDNFSDVSPSPLLVKLKYSHPTLSQRISAVETLLRDGETK